MKDVKGKLIERIKRTDSVESFRFSTEEKIDFMPGQFLQVVLDRQDRSNKALNKYLSFSSGPQKDYIEVTKKLTDSEFSNRLKNLRQGEEVLFKAPMGKCIFKDEYNQVGFLVGGIGITPVISILEHIADNKIDTDVCLFYSNWTKKDIAFKEQLDAWSRDNGNIKVLHMVESCEFDEEGYFAGRINEEFIKNRACDFEKRMCFIFGPPAMVNSMKDICLKLDIPKERLLTESFIGY